MKQDRLLWESQVVVAVDKHTNNYNRLDNDITCILEEVPEVVIAGNKEAMSKLCDNGENISDNERFTCVRAVLDKYDVQDYDHKDLTEELVLALYLDSDLDIALLNKWLTSICSLTVPCAVHDMTILKLKQKYGYGEEQ